MKWYETGTDLENGPCARSKLLNCVDCFAVKLGMWTLTELSSKSALQLTLGYRRWWQIVWSTASAWRPSFTRVHHLLRTNEYQLKCSYMFFTVLTSWILELKCATHLGMDANRTCRHQSEPLPALGHCNANHWSELPLIGCRPKRLLRGHP